ncbi:aminopeptidase P family protein [Bacillus sp. HMF5848]|uniref:M24 family metallopeptidase n=1 Tax=Bacillus sp. HMF5848 TaxID=2495421 RepID=UPI000F7B5138|nr:Xaa-Pro peptidase family protein [Bacillus sp. HMF5848]RSK28150.1 aminopeptidase P family protein [Bacillus sp. HMF5848]
MTNRIESLSNWLKQKDISFAFITSTPNVFYLSNFYSDPHERLLAVCVFPEQEPFLVCPAMEVEDVKNSGWSHEVVGCSDTDDAWALVEQAIRKRNIDVTSIAVEKLHMNMERFENLQSKFPNAVFVSAEEKLRSLRMKKSTNEIEIMREAAKLADFGVEVGVSAIKAGKSELEIVAQIEYELKKKGIKQMAFSTMVLAGAKTASPHGKPSLDQVKQGDLVLFDLGVVLEGYCSDITRTVAFGSVTDEQRAIYDTVLEAEQAAVSACKPGVTAGTIDKTARDIISSAGYGPYFTHRVGHGLGIEAHEYPSMSGTNTAPLEAGMIITVEPGIYVPRVGGVRIEDDVLITDTGVDILTKFPKELIIL